MVDFPAPDGEDRTHHYLYRFWRRLPERGQIAIFDHLVYEGNTTLVVVTHDPDVGSRAARIVRVRDGRKQEDGPVREERDETARY